MKLELIKMPNFRKAHWEDDKRIYRKYVITINDVIVDELNEASHPFCSREGFDQMVGARVKTYEIALNVKSKKVRGVE